MTPNIASFPKGNNYFGSIWDLFSAYLKSPPSTREASEDALKRRAFINEMLTRNPEAFTSDLDVQSMMQMYPGQF